MPRITQRKVYAVRGGSLKSFLNSVNNFLKKTKIVSTVGRALAPIVPAPYQGVANSGIDFLAKQGYGRRRTVRRKRVGAGKKKAPARRKMHVGMGALRLAGGAVQRTSMRKVYY